MLETSARLLGLLALLQARRSWSGDELARELGVTGRTLRRDVGRLRELGYEVESTSGPGGGYQLGRANDMPPLLLGEDEAVALSVALRAMVDVDGVADRALSVLVKIDQILPDRLRKRVSAVQTETISLGSTRQRIDPSLLASLAAACRDSEALTIRYRDHAGTVAERRIVPLRLVHTGSRRWYLVAWQPDREAWRTLRADRVEAVLSRGPRVARPPAPADLEEFVSEAIASAPYVCRARVAVEGTLEQVRAAVPPWIGVVRESDGGCEVSVGAPSWPAVIAQLVLMHRPFRLIEPLELAPLLTDTAAHLAGAAVPTAHSPNASDVPAGRQHPR